jgi:hypothetical protein
LLILEPGTSTPDSIRDCNDRIVLADDTLVKIVL